MIGQSPIIIELCSIMISLIFLIVVLRSKTKEALFFIFSLYIFFIFSCRKDKENIQRKDKGSL